MYLLDDKTYETLEDASKSSGIAVSTLESHIDDTWKSRKGVEHTLLEVEYADIPIVSEAPKKPLVKEYYDCSTYRDPYDFKTRKDPYSFILGL